MGPSYANFTHSLKRNIYMHDFHSQKLALKLDHSLPKKTMPFKFFLIVYLSKVVCSIQSTQPLDGFHTNGTIDPSLLCQNGTQNVYKSKEHKCLNRTRGNSVMDIPLKEGRGNDDYTDKIHVKDRHKGDKKHIYPGSNTTRVLISHTQKTF